MEEYLFDEYHESCAKREHFFTEKEYEGLCADYDINYGPLLPADTNCKILDIGSGTGHLLYYLKKNGYTDFLGIDISQQQVDHCRKNVSEKVEKADAFEFLKNKGNTYDVIVAQYILEHIPKERIIDFLRLIHGALKPQGICLTKVPNMANPFALRARYMDYTHSIGFNEKSLYQVLWMAGFRDIKVVPLRERGLKAKFVGGAIRFCLKKLMWHQGFVADDIMTSVIIGVSKK